jgi:hypothetical protein
MPCFIIIDSSESRQQRVYKHPERFKFQRDYNEAPQEWKEVGIIQQPYDNDNRAVFLDNDLPKEFADCVRNSVVFHGTMWRE